jgi:NUDIX domain
VLQTRGTYIGWGQYIAPYNFIYSIAPIGYCSSAAPPVADIYPDSLSISITGRVQAGESSSAAMRRELQEELDLSPADVKIDFFIFFQTECHDQRYLHRSPVS